MANYHVPSAKYFLSAACLTLVAMDVGGLWLVYRALDKGATAQAIGIVFLVLFNVVAIRHLLLREPTQISIDDDGSIEFHSPLKTTRGHVMDVTNIVRVEPGKHQINFKSNGWIQYREFPQHSSFLTELRRINPSIEEKVLVI